MVTVVANALSLIISVSVSHAVKITSEVGDIEGISGVAGAEPVVVDIAVGRADKAVVIDDAVS